MILYPISKWNTSNVIDMSYMFFGAENANPDVSKWNTSKVINIKEMFAFSGAAELDLSNWDINKITENENVFKDTWKILSLIAIRD